MPNPLFQPVTIAVTAKALFDLTEGDAIFKRDGIEAYRDYQVANEALPLSPGPAFSLVQACTRLFHPTDKVPLFSIQLISQHDVNSGVRVLSSINHHNLRIDTVNFTGGRPQAPYLKAYNTDLFLSSNPTDVAYALSQNCAAATIYPRVHVPNEKLDEVRIAFDGDCVVFGSESERAYRSDPANPSWDKFVAHEKSMGTAPLEAGPFKGFLTKLYAIQKLFPPNKCPLRTALVTARSLPVSMRPLLTLRHWKVEIDEAYFLNGRDKSPVLQVFSPHIFFDDQENTCNLTSERVPTGRVPNNL